MIYMDLSPRMVLLKSRFHSSLRHPGVSLAWGGWRGQCRLITLKYHYITKIMNILLVASCTTLTMGNTIAKRMFHVFDTTRKTIPYVCRVSRPVIILTLQFLLGIFYSLMASIVLSSANSSLWNDIKKNEIFIF